MLAFVVLAGLAAASGPADARPSEDDVKAAFVYQFTRFVEWPPAGEASGEFVVAVLGADHFSAAVERALNGRSAQERPIAVRRISGLEEAPGARIVFVGASEAQHLARILAALDGSGVLTVGDADGFAERGGMIGFRTVDSRVRFDINAEQAARAGLKISSEVLKLARVVRTRSAP